MKLRFPLFAKILLWFFLNLLLIGAVLYGFFSFQFHFGLDSLLAGQAGERVDAISRVLRDELREKPRSEWTTILKRFSTGYGVRLLVFRFDGTQAAGEPTPLPSEVMQRLKEFRPMAPLGRPQRPQDEFGEPRPVAAPPPDPAQPRPHPKFMVRTGHPTRYWVGTPLPAGDRNRRDAMPQEALIVFSETLSGGGLFLDIKPWIKVGFGAVLLSVLFWLPMIRGITRSVAQVTHATEQVAEGRFDVRVNERRRDELGRLGGAINRMAGRLNGFVTGQKRFLGDVAHELCSPLARMQVALGILEQRADEKQQVYVADVREEVQHMSELVNELLSFSKAGLKEKEIKLQPVRLAELAQRVVAREAADQVQIEIPAELEALAEPDLIARALANLVRNALRYAGNAGPITITGSDTGSAVTITVADSGPGVPPETLQQIFDPFYRLEASRSRDTGGIGLGLAIVKTCVEACQGTVTAKNRQPTGLEVEIKLKRS